MECHPACPTVFKLFESGAGNPEERTTMAMFISRSMTIVSALFKNDDGCVPFGASYTEENSIRVGPLDPRLFKRRRRSNIGYSSGTDDPGIRMPGILHFQAGSETEVSFEKMIGDLPEPYQVRSSVRWHRSGTSSLYAPWSKSRSRSSARSRPGTSSKAGRDSDGPAILREVRRD